jgi:hypothetical protein
VLRPTNYEGANIALKGQKQMSNGFKKSICLKKYIINIFFAVMLSPFQGLSL